VRVCAQDSDFLYLTGCTQPGVVALLERGGAAGPPRFTLVVPPAEGAEHHRLWWGPRVTRGAATQFFGADAAEEHGALPELLAAALRRASGGVAWGGGGALDASDAALPPGGAPLLAARALRAAARALGGAGPAVARPVRPLLAALRWRKSPAEAALLRASAALSAAGLGAAAGAAAPGATEGAAAAAHEARCRAGGAQRLAYPSVCGVGAGACAVHHNRYDAPLRAGDVLLLDAGCELHGYVSDVTRAWPIARRFTPQQRALYDAVAATHAACLAAVRPGASLASLHALSVAVLSECIASLGLIPGATAPQVARGPYFRFFPHALGHPLGLDTHDTPDVPGNAPLQPGCVITVEPGLYVWPDAPGVPDAFRGLGVRIEDDVLVTPDGCEVLSADAPVAAADVEDWAAEAREDAAAAAAAAAGARRRRRSERS
jgi:Xaa-Pro aminopeptidase